MADLEYIQGLDPDLGLIRAGAALREAQHEWCESFLRYKLGGTERKPITDTQARAMADLDVDLVGARIAYEYARLRYMAEVTGSTTDPEPEATT